MALAGARGQTAAEIAKVLGQPGADLRYHSELAALLERIARTGNADGIQFLNANRLWLNKSFKILPDFGNTLQETCGAPAVQLDFARDLEGCPCGNQLLDGTGPMGKFANLFGPGTLNGRTRLVLSSATWFLGKWEHAFRRADTWPEPFQLTGGGKEQVYFMHQTGRFGYAETAVGQRLEMRYAGGGLAFGVVLPKEAKALDIDPWSPDGMAGKPAKP
jgi:serpin B